MPSPLITRRSNRGYMPLPGTSSHDHPEGQIVPNKHHVTRYGKDTLNVDTRAGNG